MNILKATKRTTNTSGQINKLRSDGFIPAVLYGGKKNNLNISLKKLQLQNVINTETFMSKVFDLDIDGNSEKALPREVAYDPVSDEPIHIDFIRIEKGSTIILDSSSSSDSSSDSSSSSVSGTYTVNGITYDVATGRPISGVTGGSTTKIFSETSELPKFPKNPPPPQELTAQQLKAYRTLIRDNPQDEQWQEKISELKDKYPRLANEQNFTTQQIDKLSESEYEAYTNRLEKYSKAGFPNVQPVS